MKISISTGLMKRLLPLAMLALLMQSCIEDGMSTDVTQQPTFSVDTLWLGQVFTGQPTPTHAFRVYNRHNKVMNLESVRLRDESANSTFRLNVDGRAGRTFENVEIRPGDSIFVLVEATLPPNGVDDDVVVSAHVDFLTHGRTESVVIAARGRDVMREHGTVITEDTRWQAGVPRQIFDSLVVAEGAVLTLDPGVELRFHDKAHMYVRGRLISLGTQEQPVVMTGDRTDNVVADIPFDLMASQWDGMTFSPGSSGSRLEYTIVKNMSTGVYVDSVLALPDGTPGLTVIRSRLRNSANYCLASYFSDLRLVTSEIADAGASPLLLMGGNVEAAHLTVSNYYLFAAISLPLVNLLHATESTAVEGLEYQPMMSATFANCVFYGLGKDINVGDLTGSDVYMRRCLFKSVVTDDDNFRECIGDVDPLFHTVRDEYVFDYRPYPESPVVEAADGLLTPADGATDWYGIPLTAIGAYAPYDGEE